MADIDRRSRYLASARAVWFRSLVVSNATAILGVGAVILGIILPLFPGSGEQRVFRTTITAFGPSLSTTNPGVFADVIMPDGQRRSLRLTNAAGCGAGSSIRVTETTLYFRRTFETDPLGCRSPAK